MFLMAFLAIVPVGKLGFVKLSSSNCYRSCVGSVGSVIIAVLFLSLVGIIVRFVALSFSVVILGVAGPLIKLVVVDFNCHIDVFY
jgi:hypothetical protein